MSFTPTDGTTSTLRAANRHSTILFTGNLNDGADIIDPDDYILTTQEGYQFYFTQGFGLKQITDPNGHTLTYNKDGIIHSAGKSVQFIRDTDDRITDVIDPMGNRLRYDRDTQGNLIAATDRDTTTVRYRYDDNHALTEIIDPLNRPLVRNIYDDAGRLIAQRDSDGNETRFDHDLDTLTAYDGIANLRESVITDRLNRVSQIFYDTQGNIAVRIDPELGVHTYTHDTYGNQLSYTNPLGHTETTTYDDTFRVTAQTDAEGHTTQYQYIDAEYSQSTGELRQRRQEIITDANGNRFETHYDDRSANIQSLHLSNNQTLTLSLQPNGLPASVTDALNRTTTYSYDSFGNKLSETDPEGHTVTWTYDANGNQLSETRQRTVNGQLTDETTTYRYNAAGRLTQTTYPDNTTTKTEYTPTGQLQADIDSAGRRTEYRYDLYGNLIETRYPDGSTATQTYDAENNLLSVTERDGLTTRYSYDKNNRQTQITTPSGTTHTTYDLAGNVTQQTDQNGNPTTYTYDNNNRQQTITDAANNTISYQYDPTGNLTHETRPDDNGQRSPPNTSTTP